MAHWNITQLTELKVQFLLEKCKVYFKVKICHEFLHQFSGSQLRFT